MYNAKNYHEDSDKWVIGGTLELKEEATLIGFPFASNQTESKATTLADLKTDFNSLLEKLKSSGLMEIDSE